MADKQRCRGTFEVVGSENGFSSAKFEFYPISYPDGHRITRHSSIHYISHGFFCMLYNGSYFVSLSLDLVSVCKLCFPLRLVARKHDIIASYSLQSLSLFIYLFFQAKATFPSKHP